MKWFLFDAPVSQPPRQHHLELMCCLKGGLQTRHRPREVIIKEPEVPQICQLGQLRRGGASKSIVVEAQFAQTYHFAQFCWDGTIELVVIKVTLLKAAGPVI